MFQIIIISMLTLVRATPVPEAKSIPNQVAAIVAEAERSDSLDAATTPLVPFRGIIDSVAKCYNLPPALIAAIVQEESAFNPWAERAERAYAKNRKVQREAASWSRKNSGTPSSRTELEDRSRSMGAMQVMGEVARNQGFSSKYLSTLFDPKYSISQGALLLRHLLNRYHGDTLRAISAYNQGTARRHHGSFENARYVYRVVVAWREYQRIFSASRHLKSR